VPDEQPTRRERRRLEIRTRILDASVALFEAQGYEATTVNEIAQKADIAYGTFFKHFPSKLELLRELSGRMLQELFSDYEALRKGEGTFEQHLVALFEKAATEAEERGPQARDLVNAMMTLAYPETAVSDDRRMRLMFRRFLEDGLAAGDVRKDVSLDVLSEVVVGTWYSMFLSWAHFDGYPLRERASETAAFLASTLAPAREA
jgi:AcrR family transcriptional regulator